MIDCPAWDNENGCGYGYPWNCDWNKMCRDKFENRLMIPDKRKLFIMIGAKAFRTCDKELLERYTNNFVYGLNEEEIDFALSLFKEK